jgi:hypothetical protein
MEWNEISRLLVGITAVGGGGGENGGRTLTGLVAFETSLNKKKLAVDHRAVDVDQDVLDAFLHPNMESSQKEGPRHETGFHDILHVAEPFFNLDHTK